MWAPPGRRWMRGPSGRGWMLGSPGMGMGAREPPGPGVGAGVPETAVLAPPVRRGAAGPPAARLRRWDPRLQVEDRTPGLRRLRGAGASASPSGVRACPPLPLPPVLGLDPPSRNLERLSVTPNPPPTRWGAHARASLPCGGLFGLGETETPKGRARGGPPGSSAPRLRPQWGFGPPGPGAPLAHSGPGLPGISRQPQPRAAACKQTPLPSAWPR